MLYAIGDPLSLLVLLVSFLVAVTLVGWTGALVAARQGDHGLRQQGRTRPDPRRQVDPFGVVAAAVAGFGWARPLELPGRRRPAATALVLLAGPLLVLALGLGALAGFGAAHGPAPAASGLLQQGAGGLPAGQLAWLLSGLMATYVGALSLVPLPPLPGGRLLFALAPRSPGWQRAELQLVERNLGVAVLLVLLLIPLGGPVALLPRVLDSVLGPLVRLVSGG